MNIFSRKQKIALAALLLVACFLIFFRLTRHDIAGDDGHYAFVSIGYFDYLESEKQTTPVQWFGYRPWWSYLSFAAHPPLFFFIQHLFFKIFGVSLLVSRLPSALAAIGSVIVIFFIAGELADKRRAFFTAAASASAVILNNYFIWLGRTGLLENVFVFFILAAVLFFIRGLKNDKNFLWCGIFLGLAFLTKYTVFFFLPAFIFYIVFFRRNLLGRKNFWLGLLFFFILTLPVIVYNTEMYRWRGHFDAQFTDLFRQSHADWPLISQRSLTFEPIQVLRYLAAGYSRPYLGLFLFALGYLLFFRRQKPQQAFLPILIFFSLFLCFSIVGAETRWLGVTTPFAALIIGLALAELMPPPNQKENRAVPAIAALGAVLALYLLFYTLNSNTFYKPIGAKFFFSSLRMENYGYRQLDDYLTRLLENKFSPPWLQAAVNQGWYPKIKPEALDFSSLRPRDADAAEFRSLVIYDVNTSWFSMIFTIDRWRFYHRFLIMSSEEFMKEAENKENLRSLLKVIDAAYFIRAEKEVAENSMISYVGTEFIAQGFRQAGIVSETIKNDNNKNAFYVYKVMPEKFAEVFAPELR